MKASEVKIDPDRIAILRELPSSTGNGSLLPEIVSVYLRDTPTVLQALKDAYQKHDFQQLRAMAHRLKGSASNFGAEPLTAKSLEIEQQADKETLPEPEAIEQFANIVNSTLEALRMEAQNHST